MSKPPALTMVETPTLLVGYEISGPVGGYPVILLHGWPDDVRTWDRILPDLHRANLKTIVPYVRGVGPTKIKKRGVTPGGELIALGQDLIEFAEAINLERFAIVGHDWGARAVYIASCLAGPKRISHCAALSVGWVTNHSTQVLELSQIQNYWFHWYMALDQGADFVRNDRRAFTRYLWEIWSGGWRFTDEEFDLTAGSFDNPDWAELVIHNYRARWGLAPTDPGLAATESRLSRDPTIYVPTLVIHGGADSCNVPSTSEGKERYFTGGYRRVIFDGVGHFPQRQVPAAVADELVRFLSA